MIWKIFITFLPIISKVLCLNITCNYQVIRDIMQYNIVLQSAPVSQNQIQQNQNQYDRNQVQIQQNSNQQTQTQISEQTKLQNVYHCLVSNGVTILSSPTKIFYANGLHSTGYTENDVTSIEFKDKTIYYLPSGIDEIFKNLLAFSLTNSKLREICEEDLKNFSHLRFLNLANNELTILESELFKFNQELETIILNSNKIHQIEANVFESLPNLSNLWMEKNSCISKNADSKNRVTTLIAEIKSLCMSCNSLDISLQKCTNDTIELKVEIRKKDAKISELKKKLDEVNEKA
ncbi:hypothetical protein PVAND_015358 [Polypedilum vanderplanki]|uniref:Leucine rich repeat protein n=1 Tax=Polypedilum vanderplanki TaxID=319348 RepID=A0A9J6BCT1_POLVA|nr:hypothetical protein PVAND_015358 [Polypedilum vanderplanki]